MNVEFWLRLKSACSPTFTCMSPSSGRPLKLQYFNPNKQDQQLVKAVAHPSSFQLVFMSEGFVNNRSKRNTLGFMKHKYIEQEYSF